MDNFSTEEALFTSSALFSVLSSSVFKDGCYHTCIGVFVPSEYFILKDATQKLFDYGEGR
tara:strand:- start:223 stop:402 length:180 start_codon:yes stop_codon:yes gene_type:complete